MGTFVSGIVAAVVGIVLAGATAITAVNVASPDSNPPQEYNQDEVIQYGDE